MSRAMSQRRRLVREAMNAPYLEREEERDLAIRWRDEGDKDALDRLTSSHMRLVIAIASRFRHFGLSMSDMIQEGHVGLLEAASRFEPERDVRFSTYATWWIRASIQDFILRNWSIVRGGTSSSQKALFFNLRRIRAKLNNVPDDTGVPLHDRIATAMGANPRDVETMLARLSSPDMSLNAPVSEVDSSQSAERQDFLVCERPLQDQTVGDQIDTERRGQLLDDALQVLNPRELRIVRERRLREDGATLESLGQKLGISKERVRQIETRALEKLRDALVRSEPDREAFVG
ncbi:MAG: RNA polymerase factor sigma-32 [Pseudomonadota bacterium]